MPRSLLFVVTALLVLLGAQAERDKRFGASTRYLIEVDTLGSAVAVSLSGGNVTADVVTTPATGGGAPQKRLGAMKVVPVTVEVAAGDLLPWLTQAMGPSPQKIDGRILEVDSNFTIVSERTFSNALVTEVAFPALDAAAKDPARVKLTFQPEQMMVKPVTAGAKAPASLDAKAKRATVSTFRVTIPGVECSGVAKVEPITIKHKVTPAATGDARGPQYNVDPAGVSFGDLMLGVLDSKAGGFAQWHESAVVKGDTANAEKSVTIELLSTDLETTILTLEGLGVGIVTVRPSPSTSGDQPKRVEAQMYVEQWRLK